VKLRIAADQVQLSTAVSVWDNETASTEGGIQGTATMLCWIRHLCETILNYRRNEVHWVFRQ
jgi:hypothetical protein